MSATAKVFKKVAAQIQSGDTYEYNAMFLLPFTSMTLGQIFEPIADEGISGVPFNDIPRQGNRKVEGSLQMQLDSISSPTILEAGFGASTGTPIIYTLGTNSKKLSIAALDAIKCVKLASVFIKRLKISGTTGQKIILDCDFIAEVAEDRAATSEFPSVTSFGEPMTFLDAGGTSGYFRVGDATDALAAGDNINIEEFMYEIQNGFDNQFVNAVGTLRPVYGMGEISATGSFRVARHENDNYFAWSDGYTPLQMSCMLYKSASENLLIEVPRFCIQAEPTDDSLTKINCEMKIGRNGLGTSYKNANMTFVSPIRLTADYV
jgi:hypothetical protein